MDKRFITANDVLFYIIYSCDAPTSLHDVQRIAKRNFHGVKFPKGYKRSQTELYGPKNNFDFPEEMGMYHVKNVAIVDLAGLNKFLDNSCLRYECETLGSMTIEYGLLPAKSFSNCDGSEYFENAYISAIVSSERIDEAILAQTGHEFSDLPEDMKKSVQEYLYKIGDVLDRILEGVADSSSKYEPYEIPEEISNALSVDFCQMALAF